MSSEELKFIVRHNYREIAVHNKTQNQNNHICSSR
jgi:hypothetical protein